MSDYYHANKMVRNGCPKCGGDSCGKDKYNFKCEDCGLAFP